MERYNLKRLNNVEVKEQCQVKILCKFASLGNLDDDDDDDDVTSVRLGEVLEYNIFSYRKTV
jgi:hypothetical protein